MEMDEEMQESMQKLVEDCLRDMDEQPFTDNGDSLNDEGQQARFFTQGNSGSPKSQHGNDSPNFDAILTVPHTTRHTDAQKTIYGLTSELSAKNFSSGKRTSPSFQRQHDSNITGPFNKAFEAKSARSSQLDPMEDGDERAYMSNLLQKYEEMQQQLQDVEEEANKLRETKALLEQEQLRMSDENEALKIRNADLIERTTGTEQDVDDKIRQSQENLRAQQEAVHNEHTYEMNLKEKKIAELNQEILLIQR